MFRSILVPLDGSPFGEHALPLALALARRAGAILHLVHVHVPLAAMEANIAMAFEERMDALKQKQEQAYLEEILGTISAAEGICSTKALLQGPTAQALVEYAADHEIDLVVSTSHGRGPIARAWLGSVADEMVRRMPAPVLLVRPHEAKIDWDSAPSVKHVMIMLDGSPLAEQIIEPALAVGALMKADFTLLQILQPMVLGNFNPVDPVAGQMGQTILQPLRQLHEEDKRRAESYLAKVAQGLRIRSFQVQARVVVHEQPAVAILNEVQSHRADLVAIETHGRSGPPRLFLGSVADKVLRSATVPVLIHRPCAAAVG